MSDSELLGIKGVGPVTAARLGEAGFGTIAAVAAAPLYRLVEVTRFPPARATTIRQAASQSAISPQLTAAEAPPVSRADADADTGVDAVEKKKDKGKKSRKKKKQAAKDKGGKKKDKGKKDKGGKKKDKGKKDKKKNKKDKKKSKKKDKKKG